MYTLPINILEFKKQNIHAQPLILLVLLAFLHISSNSVGIASLFYFLTKNIGGLDTNLDN